MMKLILYLINLTFFVFKTRKNEKCVNLGVINTAHFQNLKMYRINHFVFPKI
jgi:hypothetical protein